MKELGVVRHMPTTLVILAPREQRKELLVGGQPGLQSKTVSKDFKKDERKRDREGGRKGGGLQRDL